MYSIGDKIVYPMYGAGVIEALEERVVDDNVSTYYVLRIAGGNLKIYISTKKIDKLGIRKVHSPEKLLDIISNADKIEMSNNWTQRYKDNSQIIKSGELKSIAQVYKTLLIRQKKKCLSSGEKRMLGNIKQIIVSEIVLADNMEKAKAEKYLDEIVLADVV